MEKKQVQILMGSESDGPIMQRTTEILKKLGVSYYITVASAHRSPKRVQELIKTAPERGIKVFIIGAGAAAHLAGVVAAHSILPVIGVPINSSPLEGWDALLATVQMPPGVPVATVSVGSAGATNAGVLAAQILAVGDSCIANALSAYKEELAKKVEKSAANIENT
jgi:phosphoribosylamine--glycine ligase